MFKYGSIRNFVIKFFVGIVLFVFGLIYFVSLYTHSPNDPGYNNNFKGDENILGIYGAYLSDYSLVFVGTLSYLFALFLTIEGGKFLLGIPSRLIISKFLSILLGIISINVSLKSFDELYLKTGEVSNIIINL